MRTGNLIITLSLFFSTGYANAQNPFEEFENLFITPKNYIIYRNNDSMKIDALMNEASWLNAPWSELFIDIRGNEGPVPEYNTRFKMLWDEENLYIVAELEEPDVWSTLWHHDDIVFHDNDFEIFIDPDGDTHNYFEIEINAGKTIFDLFMPKPYRNWGDAEVNWDATGILAGTHIDGTLNLPGDTDKKWMVELSIPFKAMERNHEPGTPVAGKIWRMNFSRVQWDTEIRDGSYVKKKDSTGKNFPEHNWVWSSQGVVNMHYPERWGYILFSSYEAPSTTDTFEIPFAETMKKYLWLVYYKQQQFLVQQKRYAEELSELNIPASFSSDPGYIDLEMKASASHFTATVSCRAINESWSIDEEGRVIRKSFKG